MFLKGQFFIFLMFVSVLSFGQKETKDNFELPPPPPPKDTSKASSKVKIWQNDEYKIRLSVPITWKTITPNEGEIVSFVSLKKEIFALRPYHLVFAGTSEEIRQTLETSLKSQFPKHKVISSKIIKIGNMEASDIILHGTIGTSIGLYRGISFHNNINSFIIICFYLPADKPKYDKIVNEILNSITFY